MEVIQQRLQEIYQQHFKTLPKYFARAPGRVNLIGEHTDYNDGFVFPMAIDLSIWIAFTPNQQRHIRVVAADFESEIHDIDLANIESDREGWWEYIKGMANELQTHFSCDLMGFDAVILSDVPIGAGLSSSAAFELAIARALVQTNKIEWRPVLMAQLAQRAENKWVGVNCGIMDQLISAVGEENHAVLIDCRDLTHESIPLPKNTAVVIMDTSTRRGLVDSHYNERREQCLQAAEALGLPALRDATLDDLPKLKTLVDETVFKRARHVITENERTLCAKQAMLDNDAPALGELFKQSHLSLANDFAVTNAALDSIVGIANGLTACFGARMTGAGFGGCAVALVAADEVERFCDDVSKRYHEVMGLNAAIFAVEAVDGVSLYLLDA